MSYDSAVTLNRSMHAATETTYADSNSTATTANRSPGIAAARKSHTNRRRGVACLRASAIRLGDRRAFAAGEGRVRQRLNSGFQSVVLTLRIARSCSRAVAKGEKSVCP